MKTINLLLITTLTISACRNNVINESKMKEKVMQFAEVTLTSDLKNISSNHKEMLKLFFEAADIMDDIFWQQAYGNKNQLTDTIKDNLLKKYIEINYGPWERLNGNLPILPSLGKKPEGANFYPPDLTKEEFDASTDPSKKSHYTMLRRDENGHLKSIPYHIYFAGEVERAAALIRKAAQFSEDDGLRKYLELRAAALLTDDYQPSDMAWMDMNTNIIDFIVGPIENYEDQLFGHKAAYEAFILLKDIEWSQRLNKYAELLPALQKKLPVEEKYKMESPGSNSDLAVYDVLYYAGDCNAGSKTIAINLPNDEEVQLLKGSRRLQLKNSMKAKFDQILTPISNLLIDEQQKKYITFDAFFSNVMFHEVAHGLGIKNTLNGAGTVRDALKDQYTTIEEGKADILGLFLETELKNLGELDVDLMENYTTFLAGIFRSIRFGSASSHGKANLIRFNYFKENGAFVRDSNGKYLVEFNKMQQAVTSLSEKIITIQGDGNYDAACAMVAKYGVLSTELEEDLNKINSSSIPVDIVFKQGKAVLGL